MSPHSSSPAKVWPGIVLFCILLAASTRLLLGSARAGTLFSLDSPLFYQAGTLGFNYVEFGAIRRGLGGTVVHLLGPDMLAATIAFHLLSAAAVAGPVAWLFSRLQAPLPTRLAYAFTAVSIMLRWAEDAGRTDMAVAALLACATIAVVRSRLVPACACLGVGLFIHESSFIFGLPLLAALMTQQGRWRSTSAGEKISAAAVVALALLVYAGIGLLPHADTQTIVDTVRAKFPPHEHVDWAIYFAMSGMRGVKTSLCQNATDPSYWTHFVGGLIVLSVLYLAVAWRTRCEWSSVLVAALPGFVFLSVVANDSARWAMFAGFNVWLVCVSFPVRHGQSDLPTWLQLMAAPLFLVLIHPKAYRVEFPIYAPSPAVEKVVRELGGPPTPSVLEALQRCDPDWRSVLGERTPR